MMTFSLSYPWPWWLGGILIGSLVPILYYFHHTKLGVSTGYGSLLRLCFPSLGLTYFRDKRFSRPDWRLSFLPGMVLGALFASVLSGRTWGSWEMGVATDTLSWSIPQFGAYFFLGGLLLGLGARLAGGCTSGRSIRGLALLEASSLLVTIVFLVFGVITAAGMRSFLLGGM